MADPVSASQPQPQTQQTTFTVTQNPGEDTVHYTFSNGPEGDLSDKDIGPPPPVNGSTGNTNSGSDSGGSRVDRAIKWLKERTGFNADTSSMAPTYTALQPNSKDSKKSDLVQVYPDNTLKVTTPDGKSSTVSNSDLAKTVNSKQNNSQQNTNTSNSAPSYTALQPDGKGGNNLVQIYPDNSARVTTSDGKTHDMLNDSYAKFMNWHNGLNHSQRPQVNMTQGALSPEGTMLGDPGKDRVMVTEGNMLQYVNGEGKEMGPPTPSIPVDGNTLTVTSDGKITALDSAGNVIIDPNKR